MYKVVVVGTDGSSTADEAVKAAAGIAKPLGASLHVVTAFKSSAAGLGQASGSALVDTGAGHTVTEDAARRVAAKAITDHAQGLSAESHAVHGEPVDALVATATEVGADLIVVGSKGMHRRVLGSVPNSVAHTAPCAVLIAKTA